MQNGGKYQQIPKRTCVSYFALNDDVLINLISYCMTYSSPISHHCVCSGITGHNHTPAKRDSNWHLFLFWVSVTYTLTRSSITVSRVVPHSNITLLFSFSAIA